MSARPRATHRRATRFPARPTLASAAGADRRALWSEARHFAPLEPGPYEPGPPVKRVYGGRYEPDREPGYVESLTHLSPTEAAELLDVERHAIYLAIRRGRLRAEPFGVKGWLITREAIDEYAADRYRRGGAFFLLRRDRTGACPP